MVPWTCPQSWSFWRPEEKPLLFPEILAAHDLLALRPAGQLVWHLLVALAEGAAVLLALIKGNRILARGLLAVRLADCHHALLKRVRRHLTVLCARLSVPPVCHPLR